MAERRRMFDLSRKDANLFGGGCVTSAIVARCGVAETIYTAAWTHLREQDAGARAPNTSTPTTSLLRRSDLCDMIF